MNEGRISSRKEEIIPVKVVVDARGDDVLFNVSRVLSQQAVPNLDAVDRHHMHCNLRCAPAVVGSWLGLVFSSDVVVPLRRY